MLIEINPNNKKHILLLFKILKKREFNISNISEIKFEDHKKFVKNNPYRLWYFINLEGEIIGTTYITFNNEIAINLTKHQINIYAKIIDQIIKDINPLPEIASVRNKYFSINVPINNIYLEKSLDELGYKPIQTSYILKKI